MDSFVVNFTLEEIPALCRICLNRDKVANIINTICDNTKLQTIYEDIIKEKVEKNDQRPQNLCHKCISLLVQTNNLYKTYNKSKMILDKLLCLNESYVKPDLDIVLHDHAYEEVKTEPQDPLDISEEYGAIEEIVEQKEIIVNALPHICQICDFGTANYDDLCTHLKIEHFFVIKSNKNECKKCRLIFQSKNELFDHFYSNEHQNRQCMSCNEEFNSLKEHFLHKCAKEYTCKICLLHLNSFEQVVSHFKEKNHKSEGVCMLCEKKLDIDTVSMHLMRHRPEWIQYTCDFCCVIFKNAKQLNEHMKNIKHLKRECKICHVILSKYDYSRHMSQKHEKKKPFCCDQCPMSYISPKHLLLHMKNCHEGDEQVPEPVNKIDKSLTPLNSVRKPKKTSKKKLKPARPKTDLCEICGKNVYKYKKREVLRHEAFHKYGHNFMCQAPDCEQTFVDRATRFNHMLEVHPKFTCVECNFDFFDSGAYQIHCMIHVWNNTANADALDANFCRICQMTVDSVQGISKHLLDEHKIFQCTKHENCSRLFCSKMAYYHHLHKAENPNKFQCKICSRKFSTEQNLKTHIKGHLKLKQFQCGECKKRFATASALKVHYRVHSGERPFKCQYCDKRFSHSHSRKLHERTHTGETPYECEHCSTRFRDRSTLREHVRRHQNRMQKDYQEVN